MIEIENKSSKLGLILCFCLFIILCYVLSKDMNWFTIIIYSPILICALIIGLSYKYNTVKKIVLNNDSLELFYIKDNKNSIFNICNSDIDNIIIYIKPNIRQGRRAYTIYECTIKISTKAKEEYSFYYEERILNFTKMVLDKKESFANLSYNVVSNKEADKMYIDSYIETGKGIDYITYLKEVNKDEKIDNITKYSINIQAILLIISFIIGIPLVILMVLVLWEHFFA